MSTLYHRPYPTCPHCRHTMDIEDMQSCVDVDLFALAPAEDRTSIKCPACDLEYWVQGGYQPHYTSAFSEELL